MSHPNEPANDVTRVRGGAQRLMMVVAAAGGLLVCSSIAVGTATALWTARAQTCADGPPTDDLCINLKANPERGQSVCTFNKEKRQAALVIGNNDYSGLLAPLCNAASDARALAGKLKSNGYDVCCLINARKEHIGRAITESEKRLKTLDGAKPRVDVAQSRFVMYFAGHGSHSRQHEDRIPNETWIYGAGRYNTQQDLARMSKPMMIVRSDWSKFPSVHPVIILDACRTEIAAPSAQDLVAWQPSTSRMATALPRLLAAAFEQPGGTTAGTQRGRGGYVVIYSTGAGSTAADRASASAGGQRAGLGRFMHYFVEEIDAWGRPLGHIFDVVRTAVEQDSDQASPPDGQKPAKVEDSATLYLFESWQVDIDRCSAVMNTLGRTVLSDESQRLRCPGMSFRECLKFRPEPHHCSAYARQTRLVQSDQACLDRIDLVFGTFFGRRGSQCPGGTDARMPVAARNVDRGTSLAEARVNQEISSATQTLRLMGGETHRRIGVPADGQPLPRDAVVVLSRTEARPQPEVVTSFPVETGVKLEVTCEAAGAKCSDEWVGVRIKQGTEVKVVHVPRVAVGPRPLADEVVELDFDPGASLPTSSSVKDFAARTQRFVDKPAARLRVTTEAAGLGDETVALAEAEWRSARVVSLLRGVGFEKQGILKEYVVVKQGLQARKVYLEFFE